MVTMGWGRDKLGDWDWYSHTNIYVCVCACVYTKQIANNSLLYKTKNSTQYSVKAYLGKEYKKQEKSGYICMYSWFTLLYTWN